MKKIGVIISLFTGLFLVLGVGCSKQSTSTTSGSSSLSTLSVSGNRIIDEDGTEVRLRGVNTTDPLWLEKLDFKANGVADNRFAEIATDFARMKELGANVVRLPLYPGYYFLIGDESYLATYVDRMVDLAEENGDSMPLSLTM